MCTKIPYTSRKEARGAARYYAKYDGRTTRPYWCQHCQAWHLTSMSSKRSKEVNKARKLRRREREAERRQMGGGMRLSVRVGSEQYAVLLRRAPSEQERRALMDRLSQALAGRTPAEMEAIVLAALAEVQEQEQEEAA